MRSFLVILITLSFLSCRDNTGKQNEEKKMNASFGSLVPIYDSLHWNNKVLSAIDTFLKEGNCNNCINEIYIDKILPDYYLITLKSRVYSSVYLDKCHPLFITKFYEKNFYVYSGIEDFVTGDKKHLPIITDSSGNTFITWTLVVKKDRVRIEKKLAYPFFPPDELLRP